MTKQSDGMQVGGGGFDLLSRLGHGDDLHKQARAEIERLQACWAEALGNVTARNQEIERQKQEITWQSKEIDAQVQEVQRLRGALRGLTDMYCRTWDRVDGALVMMPDNIERFEKAHAAAQAALGDTHEPFEQRPADGTRDGDGVWQGGFWHPDTPDQLDEWRLMEFAPKDGTRILALVTEVQFYRGTETPNELIPVVVKWTGEYSGWSMPGHGGLQPTLWLPIKLTNDPPGASRDASSDEYPQCTGEPRGCPYIYCHSQLKCAKAPADASSVSIDEHERYKRCLYRANGRLIQIGHEPEKLDYPSSTIEPIICDRCGQNIAGLMVHECDGIL